MASILDKFLTHKTNNFGGSFLKDWKKKGIPVEDKVGNGRAIDVWLHTKCGIDPIWGHNLPKLVVRDDKDSGEQVIMLWSDKYTCWEPEDVLKTQYSRNDDDTRKNPPMTCGICRLTEWARAEVNAGRISWTDPLFVFRGKVYDTRPGRSGLIDDERIIHAAGIYNGFKTDDEKEKQELKDKGIYLRVAYQESFLAKCEYIFRVVNNADVAAGLAIAREAALLGERVQTLISDRMTSKGVVAGDPTVNPFAIRWIYRDGDKLEFQKKYHALAMEQIAITDEIRDLIFNAPAPSIDGMLKPFNQDQMRAFLEKHAVRNDIPFDKLFPKPKFAGSSSPEPTSVRTDVPAQGAPSPAKTEDAPPPRRAAVAVKTATTVVGTVLPYDDCCTCDKCKGVIALAWNKCPACGTGYAGKDLIDPPPMPQAKTEDDAPPRRRSASVSNEPATGGDPDKIPFD